MPETGDEREAYDAVAAELTATTPATTGTMMGMPCLKHGGKMFAGYHHGAMTFKLGTPEHGQALALAGARLFDPSGPGRPSVGGGPERAQRALAGAGALGTALWGGSG